MDRGHRFILFDPLSLVMDGPTTSGLVLSKLDSSGGDVAGHSSAGLMIQTRPCWGGASRAEEAGRTGSIRLCWDLSESGTKPAVSYSTNIIWTQIHVLGIALFNRLATALQHAINHLPWLSVGLLINSRISANVVSSHLPRAVRRSCQIHAWFLKDALCSVHTCLTQCEPVPPVISLRDSPYLNNIQSFEDNRLDGAST